MVDLKIKQENIELYKFRLDLNNKNPVITTLKEGSNNLKSGGIRVIPDVEISNIDYGNIFITQICKSHEF